MFRVREGSTFAGARDKYWDDIKQWEETIAKVTDLFLRIQTTRQAEMVATVLYSAHDLATAMDEPPTEMDVLNDVLEWKRRRRPPVREEDVAGTIRNLAALGWLNVHASKDLPIPEEAL